jgi:N-acetyl-1-D-myo-inositol-2-amino-2-deoxy-alpha-D-glucopyranoside deacetylase
VAGSLPMGAPDDSIAAEIYAPEFVDKKIAALRAYPTQIAPDSWFFTATETIGDFWSVEHYRFAAGKPFPESDKWAVDLFDGLID